MEYLVLILSWGLWCTIHSGMISLIVAGYLEKKIGEYYRFYRLFYNLASVLTLIPVVLYSVSLKGQVLFRWEGYLIILQVLLMIIVLVLFISGGMKYDILRFLGIRQIKSGESYSTLSESGGIDTSGVLGIIRHPWYIGGIIFIWEISGTSVTFGLGDLNRPCY